MTKAGTHGSAPFESSRARVHSSRAPVTAHILVRFLVLVCRLQRADMCPRKPRIRDCNKTTDVRTTDSRTGIVPLSTTLLSHALSLSLPLFFCVPLPLTLSLSLYLVLPFSPPACSVPFRSPQSHPLSSDSSLRYLCSLSTVTDQISLVLFAPS